LIRERIGIADLGGIQMAIFEHRHECVEELHETELGYHEVMLLCGVPIAVPAAMYYCAKHGLNAPRWLVSEATKMHCLHLRGNVPKERGRSSGIINRYRQNAIDYLRWEAVIEVREQREALRKDVSELSALPGRKARDLLKERTKLVDWVGTNNDDAFECASLLLAETPARGGPDAIKKSYRTVRKNMCSPARALRYRVLDPQFLRLVDADIAHRDAPGKKIVPLYDLTG
jgi:hypothetical protein